MYSTAPQHTLRFRCVLFHWAWQRRRAHRKQVQSRWYLCDYCILCHPYTLPNICYASAMPIAVYKAGERRMESYSSFLKLQTVAPRVLTLQIRYNSKSKMKNFVAVLCIFCVALTLVNSYPSSDNNRVDGEDDLIDLSHLGTKIFGEPDDETGRLVAQYNPEIDDINPEELGSYVEGDMLMPQGFGRNGLVAQSSRWPGGIIPFEIRGNFGRFRKKWSHFGQSSNVFVLGILMHRCLSNEFDRTGHHGVSSQDLHPFCAKIESTGLHFDCQWQHRMLVERWPYWWSSGAESAIAGLSR